MNYCYIEKNRDKSNSKEFVCSTVYRHLTDLNLFSGSLSEFMKISDYFLQEGGKPIFRGIDLHFSLSHSGDYRILVISDSVCGADIQEIRQAKYIEISRRFFSDKEISYVEEEGANGFFDIWVRREAYGKMTGLGFHCNPPSFVNEAMELLNEVEYDDSIFYYINPLEELLDCGEYKAMACVKNKDFTVIEL